VVGAATGAVTNLITSKGTIGLAVGLGFLLIVGVALQVALVPGEERGESICGADLSARPAIGQYALGRARTTIIQAGGDVTVKPGDGQRLRIAGRRARSDDDEPSGACFSPPDCRRRSRRQRSGKGLVNAC
jgi:hypothetical protein